MEYAHGGERHVGPVGELGSLAYAVETWEKLILSGSKGLCATALVFLTPGHVGNIWGRHRLMLNHHRSH